MLELKSIKKLYTPNTGLHEATISIPQGQTVAFVGPNGSGKSTLFNILGHVVKADSGTCFLYGKEWSELHNSDVGFLPESSYLLDEFTPLQMITFINTLKEIGDSSKQIRDIICHFKIDKFMFTKIRKLSQGMRKRVSLACAFLGRPKLLILDEPLNALDIEGTLAFKDLLRERKEHGTIILLSSHILDFLDANVEKVVFIKEGRIIEVCENTTSKVEKLYRERFF